MYRRLSKAAGPSYPSRLIATKGFNNQASAGWTTYGTAPAAFSLSQSVATRREGHSEKVAQAGRGCAASAWDEWGSSATSARLRYVGRRFSSFQGVAPRHESSTEKVWQTASFPSLTELHAGSDAYPGALAPSRVVKSRRFRKRHSDDRRDLIKQ